MFLRKINFFLTFSSCLFSCHCMTFFWLFVQFIQKMVEPLESFQPRSTTKATASMPPRPYRCARLSVLEQLPKLKWKWHTSMAYRHAGTVKHNTAGQFKCKRSRVQSRLVVEQSNKYTECTKMLCSLWTHKNASHLKLNIEIILNIVFVQLKTVWRNG